MTPAAGSRLGSYEVITALGTGGMGEVYRARHLTLDREVAIKVLPSHLGADETARARFEREATAVAALSHPNILGIHDFGMHQGMDYAVTELLSGATLREQLQDGPLPFRKIVQIGADIADGLAAAHDKGFVHRDLKPENVFVTPDGHVEILLDAGTVTFVRQLLKPGRDPVFGPTKTDTGRTVDLAAETVTLLRTHRKAQAELKMRNRKRIKTWDCSSHLRPRAARMQQDAARRLGAVLHG